jgi:hypothetical protein
MSQFVIVDSDLDIVDLYLDEGVPWSFSLDLTDVNGDPVDLTGKTIEMEFRLAHWKSDVLLRKDNGLSGGITHTGVGGTLEVTFGEGDVVGQNWTQAKYDVKVVEFMRVIQGSVFVSPQVTV